MKAIVGRGLRALFRAAQWVWVSAATQLHWLRGMLRRRPHYIEERWPGHEGGALAGKVCVFVHFERRGYVHDFVLFYLQALRTAGFQIVFVSNAPCLDPAGLVKLRGLAHTVLRRANVGYDFGAYKDGLSIIPDPSELELLLFANDSVYGPFTPISDLLARIDPARAQFWGLTDSWERAFHLQSYFLLFGPEALRHPAFARFWRNVKYINAKTYIIRRYELGLSRQLMRAGLRGAALFSARDAARSVMEDVGAGSAGDPALDADSRTFLKTMRGVVEHGGTLNISHFFWDRLIVKLGCPFLKRELLEKNPVAVPYVSRWQDVIDGVSGYDTDMIVRHLEFSLRDRVV